MKNIKRSNTPSNNAHPFDIFGDILEVLISLIISIFAGLFSIIIKKLFGGKEDQKVIKKEDIESPKKSMDPETLGFSINKNHAFKLSDLDTKRHGLIIGASGWGKSNLIRILQENDLRSNRPLIFFDPKGSRDSIEEFINLCTTYKKTYFIFSEFYPTPHTFNPLKALDQTQGISLIMRSFEWGEPFYKARAEFALNETYQDLKGKNLPITFHSIFTYLNERKSKKDIEGLLANLGRITHSTFGKLFQDETGEAKTLEDIRMEQACLYIGLSTQGFGELAKSVGKIFLSELLALSYKTAIKEKSESYAKTHPISVYFDELGSILVPDFIDLLNKCRSSGIELTSAIQSMADLETIADTLKRQIFENCNNIFIQKQISNEDAQFLSKAIGTFYSKKETKMTLEGEASDRGSVRESQEYLCHPNRLSEIRIGQCVLLRHNPKDIDLINIRKASTSKIDPKPIKSLKVIKPTNKKIFNLD